MLEMDIGNGLDAYQMGAAAALASKYAEPTHV